MSPNLMGNYPTIPGKGSPAVPPLEATSPEGPTVSQAAPDWSEELAGRGLLEHRDRAQAAGGVASGASTVTDCQCAPATVRGSGIMAVAHAVDLEVALVILVASPPWATSRLAIVSPAQRGCWIRSATPNRRAAGRTRAGRRRVHEAVSAAGLEQRRRGAVGGVLAEAPSRFPCRGASVARRPVALDVPATSEARGFDLGRGGQPSAAEVPGAAQHARRDVEQPVAARVQRVMSEQRQRVVAFDRRPAGGAVDPADDAVCAIAQYFCSMRRTSSMARWRVAWRSPRRGGERTSHPQAIAANSKPSSGHGDGPPVVRRA